MPKGPPARLRVTADDDLAGETPRLLRRGGGGENRAFGRAACVCVWTRFSSAPLVECAWFETLVTEMVTRYTTEQMSSVPDESLQILREQAETALRGSSKREEIEPLFEKLSFMAPDGSELYIFAHRHLAEFKIESRPWQAALHLKKVLAHQTNDDAVFALLGLSHALLGNFRSSVIAYEKALAIAPANPWYHHNLGHLLDVTLHEYPAALEHLVTARKLEDGEPEISASLAHCYAVMGRLDEARASIEEAIEASPGHKEHGELLAWIDAGAPVDLKRPAKREPMTPPAVLAPKEPRGVKSARPAQTPSSPKVVESAKTPRRVPDDVLRVLEAHLRSKGVPHAWRLGARAMWHDYLETLSEVDRVRLRGRQPQIAAAALDYGISVLVGDRTVTMKSASTAYGITLGALQNRYWHMRDRLRLEERDPRYMGYEDFS